MARLNPLILAGAGRTLTTIAAQGDMHAILQFVGPAGGGTIGKSTILHDLKDLAFDAGGGDACPHCACRCAGSPCQDVCPAANISIFARSITRTYFSRINFYNAPLAGMSIACECAHLLMRAMYVMSCRVLMTPECPECLLVADGWINRVRDCLFADNHIGLHIWNQANNVSNFCHCAAFASRSLQGRTRT